MHHPSRILAALAPSTWVFAVVLCALASVGSSRASADEKDPPKDEDRPVALANGKVKLTAPGNWKKKKPRSRIVEYEFAVPMAKEEGEDGPKEDPEKAGKTESTDGRLTIMSATGGVEPNIERWIGQFAQPDGKPTKERAKVEKHKVNGHTVHYVDVSGTFLDRPMPASPDVEKRPDYRMLGAIIETEKHGLQFIKLTGPKDTIATAEKGFKEFLDSLKVE